MKRIRASDIFKYVNVTVSTLQDEMFLPRGYNHLEVIQSSLHYPNTPKSEFILHIYTAHYIIKTSSFFF